MRPTVTEMKDCVEGIDNLYPNEFVLEGSVARCAWELDMDIGTDGSGTEDPLLQESLTEITTWDPSMVARSLGEVTSTVGAYLRDGNREGIWSGRSVKGDGRV